MHSMKVIVLGTGAVGAYYGGQLARAGHEVTCLAGIRLSEGEASRVMGVIDGLPPGMKPSFLHDLEAGGPTELEILSGTVSGFAGTAGIAAPIHDTAAVALARRQIGSG